MTFIFLVFLLFQPSLLVECVHREREYEQHNVSGGSRGFVFGFVCPSFIFYPPLSSTVSKVRRVSHYFFSTHTHTLQLASFYFRKSIDLTCANLPPHNRKKKPVRHTHTRQQDDGKKTNNNQNLKSLACLTFAMSSQRKINSNKNFSAQSWPPIIRSRKCSFFSYCLAIGLDSKSKQTQTSFFWTRNTRNINNNSKKFVEQARQRKEKRLTADNRKIFVR
jgi:hypothetical protein